MLPHRSFLREEYSMFKQAQKMTFTPHTKGPLEHNIEERKNSTIEQHMCLKTWISLSWLQIKSTYGPKLLKVRIK